VAKFLLEKGADIHALVDYAFRTSSFEGHVKIMKFLLEHGADVHADNDYVLRWAIIRTNFKIINFLVDHGVKVDRPNFGYPQIAGMDINLNMRKICFFCKCRERRRIRAVNVIAKWWIPICYDVNLNCGKRMMERNYNKFLKINL
jgi:hypothetical protein